MANVRAKPWRMSLRMLLALTAVVAIGCAGMMNANESWLLAFRAGAMAIFLAAVVAAVFERGPRQAFAIGFLLCGLLHLAALRWVDDLPTRQLVDMAHPLVVKERGPPVYPPSGGIKRGSSSQLVEVLQRSLNTRLGLIPPLEVDGDFGSKTERAVLDFQRSVGLPATGVMTAATWNALGAPARSELKRLGVVGLLGLGASHEFTAMGEWLFTLLVAFVGGVLAQAAYLHRGRDQSAAA